MSALAGETRLRVRYAETDAMGVAYHSNFIIWFEVGRVELFRQLGFTYKQLEQEGFHLPVAEARCRYKAPVYYDDELVIRTQIKRVRKFMVHFWYEVLRAGNDRVLAEGETVHFVLDNARQKSAFPEKYLSAFREALSRQLS